MLQGIKERPVSVLASADTSGVVVLSVCGAYRLITIDLKSHKARTSTPKGKGRASPGGRVSPSTLDSPVQGSKRRSSAQNRRSSVGWLLESGKDLDGMDQPVLRPLQLTLSADLSLLSAIVEVDGNIELIQVTVDDLVAVQTGMQIDAIRSLAEPVRSRWLYRMFEDIKTIRRLDPPYNVDADILSTPTNCTYNALP